MSAIELHLHALCGPTHHYGGLAEGNLASQRSAHRPSNPRLAAVQQLNLMGFLAGLGVRVGVVPPQARPDMGALRRLGFGGDDGQVLASASPELRGACCSASAMWAANAATVSPSADTSDRRVHFTPANLISHFHRSLETPYTAAMLKTVFGDPGHFVHHAPLPATLPFADEGAANHVRLAARHGEPGVEIFVHGQGSSALRFAGRQSLAAGQAIARLHGVSKVRFVGQNPAATDAGAFHNDLVAVANENVLFYHADAFAGPLEVEMADFLPAEVKRSDLSLEDAIGSYLFNSQLVTLPDDSMAVIAPVESEGLRDHLAAIPRVRQVHFVDVRQSMDNGGGPACLRLRVVLTEAEWTAVHPGVLYSDSLHAALIDCVTRHYRDYLTVEDLADPKLLEETRAAVDAVNQIIF